MKKNAWLILCLIMCASARTGLCADTAGTGAAAFLKLPVDARSAGMGDAVAASAGEGMVLFQNPAALARTAGPAFAFSHALLAGDISYDVIGAAMPLRIGGLGVGVQYLRYGTFPSLDNTGAAAGSLSPRDLAFSLGYGFAFWNDLFFGTTIKHLSSKISGTASVSAMDIGFLIGGEKAAAAFAVQNMGGALKFNKEMSPLPVNVKLGGSVLYNGVLRLSADLNIPQDGKHWLGAGAEYAFGKTSDWELLARAGYNTAAADTKGLNGFSAGFGLVRNNISFDYALKTMGMLGSTHTFGLGYRLGK